MGGGRENEYVLCAHIAGWRTKQLRKETMGEHRISTNAILKDDTQ